MKKVVAIICVLLAVVACNKENMVIEPSVPLEVEQENNDTVFNVNLSITRADEFGTKATVKSAWADNDVIFVFFKGIAAPKYLEMKYNSSTDTWTSTAKNGLTSSDLSDAADKKMTAIYLPYGSTATVEASEGNFIFSDITYSGYFLKAELVTYTYDGDVLSGTLNMTAPELSNGSDKLIHFDISGFTSGHNYKLRQEYVKPLTFESVSADGEVVKTEGVMGKPITGYEDGTMLSFSGILDASVVGNAVDYQFYIDDLTASIIYTRDAGTKILSTSKYIGIGAINNPSVWNSIENVVDLGLSVKWATFNVGATAPEEYGDYFAWGETEPNTDYSWSSYKWCNGSYNTLTKYCNNSNYGNNGFIDTKTTLDSEDDVAHVKWGGSWRMPTNAERDELIMNCTWTWTTLNGVNGYRVTSKKSGYTDRSIFLPAAGYCDDTSLDDVGSYGYYWSSSLDKDYTNYPYNAWFILFGSSSRSRYSTQSRYRGQSVRPVCPSETWLTNVSITLSNNTQSIHMWDSYTLFATVKHGNDVINREVVWTSANPSIAIVNKTGVVAGVGVGSTTISATSMGKTATCTITVTPTELEYVDLGLSVNWATFNVGASKPEGYGDYFAWGETEPYYEAGYAQETPQAYWKEGKSAGYSWSSYKWCNGSSNTLTKYCSNSAYGNEGFTDTKTTLDPEDDVAHVKWGGSWRMPTDAEWTELRENCTWTWTKLNGVNGYRVTSNKTGYTDRSIFLPAAGSRLGTSFNDAGSYGYYWSSSLYTDVPYYGPYLAWYICIRSSGVDVDYHNDRIYGQSVRPVCPK